LKLILADSRCEISEQPWLLLHLATMKPQKNKTIITVMVYFI